MIGRLFDPEPQSWGLRGDPFLWHQMQAALSAMPLPASELDLRAILETTFEKLVGVRLGTGESSVFVERFAHGGMSSGHVCPEFWRDTAFPLLLKRYGAA